MADASTHYSFIDIAAWDGVRENFLSGRPIMVFSEDLQSLLWANGPAAHLFGFASIGEFEAHGPQGMRTALRQLGTAAARVAGGGEAATHLRVTSGTGSKLMPTKIRGIEGRGGARCILVVIDTGETEMAEDMAARAAIAGLATEGAGAAIVDDNGGLVAADSLFSGISFPVDAIGTLVRDVRDEKDRLVKRLVTPQPAVPVAVAIARLTDTPPRHLVMAVKSAEQAGLPEPETEADEVADVTSVETADEQVASPAASAPPAAFAPVEEPVMPDAPIAREEPQPEQLEPAEETPTPAQAAVPIADEPQAETVTEPTTETEAAFVADFDNAQGPVRFVWKTDSEGLFTDISPEFAAAVGPNAADIVGRTFDEVARVFELDPTGEISASLKRRDTWSGKSVVWPVEGTAYRVPVDLAALPSYNRQRDFEGYRGFGIVRMGERSPDPEEIGLALVRSPAQPVVEETETMSAEPEQPAVVQEVSEPVQDNQPPEEDPFGGEVPALASASPSPMRRESDKIIEFNVKRRPRPSGEALNPSEQAAFRQIGDVLGWARVKSEGEEPKQADREMPAQAHDAVIREEIPHEEVPDEAPAPEVTVSAEPEETLVPEEDRPTSEPVQATLEAAPAAEIPGTDDAIADDADEAEVFDEDDADLDEDDARTDGGLNAAFLDALPLPILIHRDDEALYANEAFVELSGYCDADALNAVDGIEALFDGETAEDGVLALRTIDGSSAPVRARLQTVQWHGRTALMFAFEPQAEMEDEADEEHPSEAAELRAILDTATDGVVVLSRDGVIRSLNASASALFGYADDDVEGKSFGILFAHESQAAALDYLAGLANNGVASVLNEGLEVLGREKNGGFLPLFMTIGRLETSNGFCAVVRDITSWKQTEQALRDAQRNAERASSHKTEFLAKISHEIRTPLNAIIGFSELMAEERFGPIGNERYKDYLADINKSGKYVLDLVNDLLDISKIEAGKQELEFESVSLNKAVEEAVTMVQPQANRSRIIIRSSLDEDLPEIVADARSLKQIVLNLLSNSVRFTHSGGQVIVSSSYNARGEVVLRIKDTGIGMSAKEIETALQPFQQVASLGRARGDGTGLGLPLTKALVEANRAEFAIQSEPGRGTAVEIVFPPSRVLAS